MPATATCGFCGKKISHEEGIVIFNCKTEEEGKQICDMWHGDYS